MVDLGCCEQCGYKNGEELGYPPNIDHVRLTVYHGMVLCQFCLEEEQAMAREDAKNGITTIWFDESEDTPLKEQPTIKMIDAFTAAWPKASYGPGHIVLDDYNLG